MIEFRRKYISKISGYYKYKLFNIEGEMHYDFRNWVFLVGFESSSNIIFISFICFMITIHKKYKCDHYYPFTNTGRILPCEFCGDVKNDKYQNDADTDDDEDYDDSDECCDTCGCYHGHHSWCRE